MKRTYRRIKKDDGTSSLVEVTPTEHLPDDLRFEGTFVSPVDGSLIRNKRELHDHNRRNNVMQSLPGMNEDIANIREANQRELGSNKERLEAVRRAYETL